MKRLALLCSSLLTGLVFAGAVHAQSADPVAAEDRAPDIIPDIVIVTGDRRGEAAGQTSLAVTRFGAEDIDAANLHHPAELLNKAPGVFLHRGNGAEHLTAIRSPVLTGGAGAGSFLYLEDGIPLRAAGFANVNGLFEALTGLSGGIEVVRGPGSAQFGSNALHGLINTLTPVPGDTADSIELEAGSLGRARGRTLWSREGEEVDVLAGFAGQHEGGWREDAGLDRGEALFRADGQTGHIRWRFSTAIVNLNQETAGFIRGTDAYKDLDQARANDDPEAYRDARAVRSALSLEGELDNGWSWGLTPYVRANEMDFLMHFLPSEALEESGHTSAGLQASLARSTENGRVTFGFDVENTEGYLRETQERPTIFSFVQGDHYDYTVDARVFALYGQGHWDLSETVSVQGGLRWEDTQYEYDNRLAANTVGRFLRLADRSDVFDSVTGHLAALWQVEDQGRFHARLARGSRAPQTAELYRLQPGQDINSIEPETLDSFELGYRRELAGGHVALTAYAMQKRNVFFRDADGINVTDGKTRHTGIEFEAEHALTDTLAFRVAGSWAQHEYDFDRIVGRSSEVIRSGARIDTAPEWLAQSSLIWQATPDTTATLDWVHVGEYFTNAANDHAYEGHDIFNLRVSHEFGGGVTVFGAVRNLFDTRYAERADFAFGSDRYFPGEERGVSVGVRLTR